MEWIAILCGVTLMGGLACLVIRGASDAIAPSAFVVSLRRKPAPVANMSPYVNITHGMPPKPRLSLAKRYRTRGGYPIFGLIYELQSADCADGFCWQAWYKDDAGRDRHVWVNDYGQWSNNPFTVTDMDLVELLDRDEGASE